MKKIYLALLISTLALFLRTYMAYNGPIEYDESIYINAAAHYNNDMRQGNWDQIIRSSENIEHPQFYKLVYATGLFAAEPLQNDISLAEGYNIQSVSWWHKFLGLRMISALLGTAATFLISMVSPWAGLFLAINTYMIKYTSVVYLEALPALTSLVALLTAQQALMNFQNHPKKRISWIAFLILSALSLGMTAASKYIYALIGFVIVIDILVRGRKQIILTLAGLAIWGLLSIFFFFLFDPVLWHSPLTALMNSINYNTSYAVGQHVLEVSYPFWQPIKWLSISIPQWPNNPIAFFINKGDYFICADTLIFVLALMGIPGLFKKNKTMLLWLLIGLGFLLAWGTKWPQYILVIMVPYCVSAAYGVDVLRKLLINHAHIMQQQKAPL